VIQGDKLVVTTPRKAKANNVAGSKPADSKAGVAVQVRFLMKACHDAMECGRHQKAADLARQAYALDAEKVQADPMVYKMHLLADWHPGAVKTCPGGHGDYPIECEESPPATPAKPMSRGCGMGCPQAGGPCDCCEECPKNGCPIKDVLMKVQEADTGYLMFGAGVYANGGLTGKIVLNERNYDITRLPTTQTLTPCLPTVDPGVVKALERLADEAEDQELTVVVEEEQEATGQSANKVWSELARLLPEKMWTEINLDRGGLRLAWQLAVGKSTYQIRYEQGNLEITILPLDEVPSPY
jgi:hypothetical protein